jgi:uncharacterized protein HemX
MAQPENRNPENRNPESRNPESRNPENRNAENRSGKPSSSALVAVAWLVVSLPLAWGIYNTGLNAAKLFTHLHQPAAAAPGPTAPAH